MTREETIKILMIVQAAYPNYKPQDKTVTVNLWSKMFQGYTYRQVESAVEAYIRTDKSGFAPNIGDVIDKMQMIFGETDELNEMSAWGLVLKAIRNSGYHAEEEFAKLPSTVQKAVASPGQLMEWALAEDIDGKTMSVMQSNFMRTYRSVVAREKELRKLSPELIALVQSNSPQKIAQQSEQKTLDVRKEREEAIKNSCPMTDRAKRRLSELFGERWQNV